MVLDRRSFLVAAGLAACATAVAPAFAVSRRRRAGTVLPWTEVRSGVWVSGGDVPGGNVLIARGEGGDALVVDAKFAYLGGAIRADAVTLTGAERITLVNTHHHGDHTSGNWAFRGDDRVAHAGAKARIAEQLERYKQEAVGAPAQAGRLAAALDAERLLEIAGEAAEVGPGLEEGDVVPAFSVGDGVPVPIPEPGATAAAPRVAATLRHFGAGHTDNDLVVHLARHNVVHTGDVVFSGLHPFFDPDGGATVFGWIESAKKVRELCDADTVVVPGHGVVGDRALLDAQIRYHESLIEAVRAEIASGVSRDEASKKTFPFFEGLGFGQIAPRAIGAVYDELKSKE